MASSGTITIRSLTPNDEAVWRKLFLAYLEYYETQPIEDIISTTFKRINDEKEPVYGSLAIDGDGKAIGFVHWVTHRSTLAVNDYIYLHDLFVEEGVRSRGTGRKLIEHVYEDADKREAARVYWQTKHDNHRAQLLYVKAGYKNGFICYQRPKEGK